MSRALVFLLLIASFAPAQNLLLHSGKIVTVDPRWTVAEAVWIRDGRIAALGSNDELLPRGREAGAPLLDLEGRTVVPGLIDSHVHAYSAAISEYRAPLPPLESFDDIRAYIRDKMAVTPKGEWIIVPRTFPTRLEEMRMPTKELLDVATEHPVLFDASYVVVVNSYALEMSKISRYTANPPEGEIVVDENGDPNGILKNGRRLLKDLPESLVELTREEQLDALEAMLERYAAAGLTTVVDRAVDLEQISLFRELEAAGRLPVRVVMTWRPGVPDNFGRLLQGLRQANFSTGTGSEWLKFGAYKVTVDGGMTIGTARQRRPYGEFGEQLYGMTNPDEIGQLFVGPEQLLAIFREARKAGWQLTAHVQGGGAIDLFIRVMEELDRDRSIVGERHHLIHASFQSPEAIERMRALGLQVDAQAPWLYYDAPALEMVMGWDGMEHFYPLRDYIDAGIVVAAGTDHMTGFDKDEAVNPYNPFFQMWMEVTRARERGEPLYPEQRVTREEALKMHTIWGAYQQFSEDDRGSIEVGKLGDLTVLDRDLFTCPEEEIREIQPAMTILEGRIAAAR